MPDKRRCSNCGCWVPDGTGGEFNGEVFCPTCYEGEVAICQHCSEPFAINEVERIDGEDCCPSCINIATSCSRCNTLTFDATELATGEDYCPNCYNNHTWVCDRCDCIFPRDECSHGVEGETVCEHCFEDSFTCEECGDNFWIDGDYDGGDGYCTNCQDNSRLHIRDYSYKPSPEFLHLPDESRVTPHFGVELEVDANRETAPDGSDSRYYYKHDGSLGRDGVELVTHPMSLKFHKKFWRSLGNSEGVIPAFNRSGDKTDYGIHIHIDKVSSDHPEVAYTMAYMLFSFTRSKFQPIIRRQPTSYCPLEWGARGGFNTRPEYTDEIRGFKTSRKVDEILACVELADALVSFSKSYVEAMGRGVVSVIYKTESIARYFDGINYFRLEDTSTGRFLTSIGQNTFSGGIIQIELDKFNEALYEDFCYFILDNPEYEYLPKFLDMSCVEMLDETKVAYA